MGCAGVHSTQPTRAYCTPVWGIGLIELASAHRPLLYFSTSLRQWDTVWLRTKQHRIWLLWDKAASRSVLLNVGRITVLTRGTGYAAFANFVRCSSYLEPFRKTTAPQLSVDVLSHLAVQSNAALERGGSHLQTGIPTPLPRGFHGDQGRSWREIVYMRYERWCTGRGEENALQNLRYQERFAPPALLGCECRCDVPPSSADGRQEPVLFDKITSRISKLCYGLNQEFIDPAEITMKVISGVYPGITTVELDTLAAETSASMTTRHPDYATLAARIAVSNLHKETKKQFSS